MLVPMGAARSSRLALRMVSSASMLGGVMAMMCMFFACERTRNYHCYAPEGSRV